MHAVLSALTSAAPRRDRLTIFASQAITHTMLIYKILRSDEWAALQANGETVGAPIDVTDGYIHFSTSDTVAETAAKYFAGVEGLVLLAVQADGLQPLKWEPARKDVLFPHLYRSLCMADIAWYAPLPLVDGVHQFPPMP